VEEDVMAQDAVGGVVAPDGGLFRAWLDVLVHPKFATFQRWYPRMRLRWRAISLVVSLLLAFAAGLVVIAHDAMFAAHFSLQAFSLATFRDYLLSPHGLFQWFCFWFGAIVAVFLVPAVAAAIGYRPIGPYHVRFRVVFGTWMQALPDACLFLLIGALGYFVLGFFDASSIAVAVALYVFSYIPIMWGWGLTIEALAAGSGRRGWQIYWMTVIIYIFMCLLFWTIEGHILALLGHPV
jgi:hypothetical protein